MVHRLGDKTMHGLCHLAVAVEIGSALDFLRLFVRFLLTRRPFRGKIHETCNLPDPRAWELDRGNVAMRFYLNPDCQQGQMCRLIIRSRSRGLAGILTKYSLAPAPLGPHSMVLGKHFIFWLIVVQRLKSPLNC